jgi:hypothetical protein
MHMLGFGESISYVIHGLRNEVEGRAVLFVCRLHVGLGSFSALTHYPLYCLGIV